MSLLEPGTTWPRGNDLIVLVLAGMLLLLPAVGVPSELLLQDTLKSALVSFAALGAALLLCRQQLREPGPLYWHPLLWLPLMLLAWALGSMVWSHTYLAGAETVRWFIFALLLWLGLQVLDRDRLPLLAQGIHWGSVMAALWVALQFWIDLQWFPQAATPAATFANRNFLAEYLVCALPFSAWLAAQSRGTGPLVLRVFTLAFNILAILMTGTRSAMLTLLVLMPLLVLILYRYRAQFAWPNWNRAQKMLALVLLPLTLLGLGSIPPGSARLLEENPGRTVLERSLKRTQSMGVQREYEPSGSMGTRFNMWRASVRMALDQPWTGVGAGAWEVQIPRYQAEGMDIEEDYYAHNEPLQLLAEYGLAGWFFLIALAVYLLWALLRTWRLKTGVHEALALWRALALASLLALFIVGMAGFPWHLAGTTAIFAVCLGLLAASDRELAAHEEGIQHFRLGSWKVPAWCWRVAAALLALCLMLAAWITYQAYACESRLVRASQIAYQITLSGRPDDPAWDGHKVRMLQLMREGTTINPHYRKITTLVADELVRWGDYRNARWVWESVDGSRPYIVVLLTNLGRAYAQDGDELHAQTYLARALALQPRAIPVRSLQLFMLLRAGQDEQARELAQASLDQGIYDYEILTQAYQLGMRQRNWALATQALTLRIKLWPPTAVESWLRLAQLYAMPEAHDSAKALAAYRAALQALPEEQRENLRRQIPQPYRSRL